MDIYGYHVENVEEVFFIFDIDGVICQAHHPSIEKSIPMSEWLQLKSQSTITEEFVTIVKKLQSKKIPFCFVTGRKGNARKITENMFEESGIGFCTSLIYYYPQNFEWSPDPYVTYKRSVAQRKYDETKKTIVIIDDSKHVIEYFTKLRNKNYIPIHYALPYL